MKHSQKLAYSTICRAFRQPTNAFLPGAYLWLFEGGGLSRLGIGYGVGELPAGEYGNFDPQKREIILSEATYYGLKEDRLEARLTLAHEIGHAVMHGKYLREGLSEPGKVRLYKRVDLPARCNPEWQAEVFAKGSILPATQLSKLCREGYSVGAMVRYFRVPRCLITLKLKLARQQR